MSKIRTSLLAGAAVLGTLALGAAPALSAEEPSAAPSPVAASPYLYNGWGSPPAPADVMNATGIKDFTLAFINSDGGCNPAWDGQRPLDGQDKATIEAIRGAGGDVIPSIGGYSGTKLGEVCGDAQQLAAAYQELIDAYGLKAIDVDIEATEFENQASRDKVVEALKITKEANPGLLTVVTFPTTTTGPNENGKAMIAKAAEIGANIDVWTQMPFDFNGSDMAADTIAATEGLKEALKAGLGYDDADAYAHAGISSMNGTTDVEGELVDQAAFQEMADYAKENGLGRFTFWSVNRDRPCSGGAQDSCSGIDQQDWDFTKIVAGFQG
ncbi:chitinase [Saccharopolyspora rhizosphaerae]|uniref:Chitinase n=1 Tax=Saccharopolyspora rhizosphaerae TaxID=2492662 RepID=A0A3R8NXW1_9PSEU|nr:chitinase [Saccharopolyspora rhizosphaerae]RRO15606.1 chitinase [Saccharopolyspora rhizosphaerae]